MRSLFTNPRSSCIQATLAVAVLLASSSTVGAQRLSSASIEGTVTDETAAALPGVAVTLTSSALQVPQLQTVTNEDGRYRFADLPAGVFQMRFELFGFQPLIRESLQLTAGFAARINVVLKVGTLEETVTVSGASPVVDVTTTRGGQTLPTDLINKTIPNSRMFPDIARLTPGMRSTSAPNIGLLGLLALGGFETYGQTASQTMVDGVDMHSNTFPDFATAQEVDVKTFGNSADVASPGVVINLVVKSGGNDFHGRYAEQFMNHALQSNNLDDELSSQGLRTLDTTRHYSDLTGDLGGRIVRDQLWFYAALRDRRNKRTATGFVADAGPDGAYGTGDEPPFFPTGATTNGTVKLSYQASPNYQLIASWARDYSVGRGLVGTTRGAARFIPYEASTDVFYNPTQWRGEIRGTPTSTMLFNVHLGRVTYLVDYRDTPGSDKIPARFNRETQFFTGGSISPGGNYAETKRPRERWVSNGSLTFMPRAVFNGNHEFKVGYRVWLQMQAAQEPNHAAGNYQLVYDRVSGVPNQPVEIQTFNYPVTPDNRLNSYSGYVNDRWRVSKRITFNLGLRWDRTVAYLPEQTKEQGQFGSGGTFPKIDVNTWRDFAPRAAFAFDVIGDGKTVVKATYGWYNHDMPEQFAEAYNKNGVVVATYRWRDQDRNNDYTPGEVNLDLNGPDFISITGSANNLINPDLRQPHTHEITTSLERELVANMSARVLYVYRRINDDYQNVNTLRPYSAFNIPLTRRDPGPDGALNTADDAGSVTIYDYDPAYRGSAFVGNMPVNRPSSRSDYYQTIEFTLNKRAVGRWGVLTSFSATKNHRWLVGIPQSPNDEFFPVDTIWNWVYKVSGSYRLPHEFLIGGLFDVMNGTPGQRTYVFRSADPDGGLPLRQLTTVTLPLETFGSSAGPLRATANLRASKIFTFGKKELQLDLDALNAFNSNTAWSTTYVSGPTFGYVTGIVSPRIVRLGVALAF